MLGSKTPLIAALVVILLAALTLGAASASAATPAPRLTIHALAMPTNFSSADTEGCLTQAQGVLPCDSYQVTVTNSGDGPTKGPITLTDALPAGLMVDNGPSCHEKAEGCGVTFFWWHNSLTTEPGSNENSLGEELYPGEEPAPCKPEAVPVSCEFTKTLMPDQRLTMYIYMTTEPGAVSEPNTASVSEAGGPVASISANDVISTNSPPFGPNAFSSQITSSDGTPDLQAGDHPYEFATRFDLNSAMGFTPTSFFEPTTVGNGVRDVVVDLPLGFLGSAEARPKCTWALLQSSPPGCPLDTLVGTVATPTQPANQDDLSAAVFNMVPEKGVAAEFGFRDILFNTHVIDASVVPSRAGYVLRATAHEIPAVWLTSIITTFYGNPASKTGAGAPSVQFTNSSDCSGKPLSTTVYMDSWEHPGSFNSDGSPNVNGPGSFGWASQSSQSPAVSGCGQLRFAPEAFSVKPETSTADTPTGLNFDLKLPQPEAPETLATPPLRNASVTLPAGLTVDPSAASGLAACSEAQIGYLGYNTQTQTQEFSAQAPSCPDASKVGSVEVLSPLLAHTLLGSVYIATQNENPFGTLLAGYIVIDDPQTGTVVKIAGNLTPNPQTGQITATFNENPQLPFSDLKLHFFGGPRGDLATPEACGTFTTTSDLSPWSAPESGPDATPSDSFQINSGCVSGFAPAFSAGTASPQAGAFSPFTLSISRKDSEEGPAGLTVSMPQGLLGKIAGVSECSEAQVAAAATHSGTSEQSSPSCPSSSQFGTVQTASGPGPNPFVVGGKAYLTGPYKGAPFGVAVIVPALAGPFDLGTVVIRAALYIDRSDAHVTAVSDPFPTILQGIPLRIKSVKITLDRPQFTFNPTSCEQKAINATATSIGGAHAPVSSHFQVANCAILKFAPKFVVSTAGKASKANGASLDVKVLYPSGPWGTYANIHSVKVDLPKQLPSRLTTLQKACLAATFEANPANCPAASDVGTATATTPALNVPLTGPAYIVSHGGAAFPDLEMVLQGENITLILDGNTNIKHGITSSTFKNVPDAPVSAFELKLPMGKYSILGSNVPQSKNYNLCGQNLKMPTKITGQNGAVIKITNKISVTGCKKAQKATKHHKKGKGKHH
jgi:hypothetical protein